MDNQDIELRRDSAMVLREELGTKRQLLKDAQAEARKLALAISGVNGESKDAISRLKELERGRGSLLVEDNPVAVYEYWLDIPGWSGSIRGATAHVTMHGSLQQVGNVTSKSKSGLGGGVVGGLLLGPLGAAGGVLLTRKNEVKTRIENLDTRHVEFQISGPGYAWSTLAPFRDAESLRRLRDLINARGSCNDNISDLITAQQSKVNEIGNRVSLIEFEVKATELALEEKEQSYQEIKQRYAKVILPIFLDLKFRWQCLPAALKWVVALSGPVLWAVLIVALLGVGIGSIQPALTYLAISVGLHTVVMLSVFAYYLLRIRY